MDFTCAMAWSSAGGGRSALRSSASQCLCFPLPQVRSSFHYCSRPAHERRLYGVPAGTCYHFMSRWQLVLSAGLFLSPSRHALDAGGLPAAHAQPADALPGGTARRSAGSNILKTAPRDVNQKAGGGAQFRSGRGVAGFLGPASGGGILAPPVRFGPRGRPWGEFAVARSAGMVRTGCCGGGDETTREISGLYALRVGRSCTTVGVGALALDAAELAAWGAGPVVARPPMPPIPGISGCHSWPGRAGRGRGRWPHCPGGCFQAMQWAAKCFRAPLFMMIASGRSTVAYMVSREMASSSDR